MKRRTIAMLLLLAFLLTGCASKGASKEKYEEYAGAPAAAAPMAMDMAYAEEATAYDMAEPQALAGGAENGIVGDAAQQIAPNYGGRKIIRSIALELYTKDFDAHLAQLLKDAQTAGGYVQSSNIYGTKPEVAGDSGRTASVTLRIPASEADAFVNTASGYGELLSKNEDTEDVTDSYFDIETRLAVSRTTLERLENILVKTNNLSDIIELEREIARVTTEIEQLTTKLRKYDGMIEYATVNVVLREEGLRVGPAAKTPFGQRVSDGFSENLSGIGNFLEDLAVFLLSGSPVILPLVLVGWLLVRAWKKRAQRQQTGEPRETGKERRARKKAERQAKLLEKQNAVPQPSVIQKDEEKKDENE